MKIKFLLFSLLLVSASAAISQETYPVNGVHDPRHITHAFINATIFISPEKRLDSSVLIVEDGKITAVGKGVEVPKDAVIHDCTGLNIYPSFIDPYAGLNASEKLKEQPNVASNWNSAIHPELNYQPNLPLNKKVKDDWLASGFGVANIHLRDGIMRGSSSAIHIGIEQPNKAIIENNSTHHFSFSKGSSKDDYPSSHVGAVALIRQTFYDAQWYAQAKTKENNASLAFLSISKNSVNIFELNSPLSVRNVDDLSKEFDIPFVIKATGEEYLNLDEIPEKSRIILPLNFPKPLEVKDPFEARMVSLAELKHWESAPFCPVILHNEGHQLSLTRDTLKTSKEFVQALYKLSKTGLSHGEVLAMLTENPAKILGLHSKLGTLENDKIANFFISEGQLDDSFFRIVEHWNIGEQVFNAPVKNKSMIGKYNLVINKTDFEISVNDISEKSIKSSGVVKSSKKKLAVEILRQNDLLTLIIKDDSTKNLLYQLSGKISLNETLWDGKGIDSSGAWITWAAIKDRDKVEKDTASSEIEKDTLAIPQFIHPNKAYGIINESAQARTFVITNAVVWTCSDTGKLERADIWVENGKIKAVGSGMLYPSNLFRLDAKGRHVTPGIIDEHSHIGLRGGVNEGGQASSAEVRMSDAIDPWNINIYRQLAGGVTAAQLLHGSANPIGGQSALIKLKWGKSASDMLIKDADGFIKFALGENVKRSNSRNNKGRFPLTRMGVEQSYFDAFTRAQEYQRLQKPTPPEKGKVTSFNKVIRRDLELDALSEILNKKRFISCHSYVQSEILMLMDVADSFNFQVNTFTHILEGYKVANEMLSHGVSASTFSDWWAYKFEVNDAIPYNAALLTKVGVNTAINSDDAEMGRRLNQEAAKTIKYGGMSEEEALKMITINPAKMLHLDDRMGSIEVGKDADLVLWSDNPLSVYAKVEKTYIEGVLYYDEASQVAAQQAIQRERSRIITKMLSDPSSEKRAIKPKKQYEYHCDTILEDYTNE